MREHYDIFLIICSKFWCRNKPGDEMDKASYGINALVMEEESDRTYMSHACALHACSIYSSCTTRFLVGLFCMQFFVWG